MDGFIVIDKPIGVTSHTVVAIVRRVLNQRKVGHTGTLDPFATGVLPIAVGEATKAIQYLDESVKVYEAVMRLGITTDTQDYTGTVIRQSDCSQVTQQSAEDIVSNLPGTHYQIPPMYSAIKQSGVPLYKLARQGQTVERAPREITIHSLEITSFALPEITFIVTCSRGTYVRTVASDLGDALGCGAHLTALRRLQSGIFSIDTAVPLDSLQQLSDRGELMSLVISPNQALAGMPGLELTEDGVRRARCGQKITVTCFQEPPGPHVLPGQAVRLLWHGSLVAVAHCEQLHGDDDVKTFRLSRVFA